MIQISSYQTQEGLDDKNHIPDLNTVKTRILLTYQSLLTSDLSPEPAQPCLKAVDITPPTQNGTHPPVLTSTPLW